MLEIIITEFMDQGAVDNLAAEFNTIYDPELFENPDLILELISDASALIVRNRT